MLDRRSDAAKVARELLARHDEHHHMHVLGKLCALRTLRVRIVLARFVDIGWLREGWEDASTPNPPRRFYALTELGKREMPSLLQSTSSELM